MEINEGNDFANLEKLLDLEQERRDAQYEITPGTYEYKLDGSVTASLNGMGNMEMIYNLHEGGSLSGSAKISISLPDIMGLGLPRSWPINFTGSWSYNSQSKLLSIVMRMSGQTAQYSYMIIDEAKEYSNSYLVKDNEGNAGYLIRL